MYSLRTAKLEIFANYWCLCLCPVDIAQGVEFTGEFGDTDLVIIGNNARRKLLKGTKGKTAERETL